MGYGIWDMGYGIWDMGYGSWDMGYGTSGLEPAIVRSGIEDVGCGRER
jgi:hypothetical protein